MSQSILPINCEICNKEDLLAGFPDFFFLSFPHWEIFRRYTAEPLGKWVRVLSLDCQTPNSCESKCIYYTIHCCFTIYGSMCKWNSFGKWCFPFSRDSKINIDFKFSFQFICCYQLWIGFSSSSQWNDLYYVCYFVFCLECFEVVVGFFCKEREREKKNPLDLYLHSAGKSAKVVFSINMHVLIPNSGN